ncbi:MAG: 6-hydroxymethylpterin diphosphokinase MptE-like protein [Halolamina sp.]
MQFRDWEPVYKRVLGDFGYSRAADERARDLLGTMVTRFDRSLLTDIAGAEVVVAGAGPSLSAGVEEAAAADVVVAASAAAERLRTAGVNVDVMVTDLDKTPGTARELTEAGVPVAIHAHGDNLEELQTHVTSMNADYVVPTTQASPSGPVRNFGGFTDGDRAAFLADAFGAEQLTFVGWDFDDPTLDEDKDQKLRWAARLLHWLEHRRDEEFAVLDGRRRLLDVPAEAR